MIIGQAVLFNGGEGFLISVVAGVATINTLTGVVQKPSGEVKSSPVQVVELNDSHAGIEEEMTVVQQDDGDREEHAAERAEEDQPVVYVSKDPDDMTLYVEPFADDHVPATVAEVDHTGEPLLHRIGLAEIPPVESGQVSRGEQSLQPMELTPKQATQIEQSLADGSARPNIEPDPLSPSIPPGGMPTPLVQEKVQSEEIPGPPADFLSDFNAITGGATLPLEEPESAPQTPPAVDPVEKETRRRLDVNEQNSPLPSDVELALPQRFTKKWMDAQTVEFLEKAVKIKELPPLRRAKLQSELNRKRVIGGA